MYSIFRSFIALIVISLLCSCSLKKETTGEYVDDTVITSKVKNSLMQHLGSESSSIHVETFRNTVQLSGFVTDKNIAGRAKELASEVSHVKSVMNNIQVTDSNAKLNANKNMKSMITDSKITAAVKKALLKHKDIKSLSIHVTTYDREVTLSGTVKSRSQIKKAQEIAEKVNGVKRVHNNLVL